MNLIWLTGKNLRHYGRSYAAFFLSSVFAVWMFFLYGALVLHPDLERSLAALSPGTEIIKTLFIALDAVVALFSVLFVRYSHGAFLRARQAELGVLQTLGMSQRALGRLILVEVMAVGLGAVGVGVALGAVISKLFYMAMARLLGIEALRFYFAWEAALLTLAVFSGTFALTGLLARRSLRRLSVADVLRGAVKAKAPPALSVWRVALCALTLGGAYWLALSTTEPSHAEDRVWPIMGLLLVGTYLFLSQGAVGILRFLQRRPGLYLRRTNLITIAQMVYKVRDNALILFMVAILSSIALTAVGLNYSALLTAEARTEAQLAWDVSTLGSPGGTGPDRVEAVLAEHGVPAERAFHIPVLKVEEIRVVIDAERGFNARAGVVPVTAFNTWWTHLGTAPVAVAPGEAVLVTPYEGWAERAVVRLGAHAEWQMTKLAGKPFGPYYGTVLVVGDAEYAGLAEQLGGTELHLWLLKRWRASEAALLQLDQEILAQGVLQNRIGGKAVMYRGTLMGDSLLLFVSAFLGALFFLASGNMLYFKLFTDLQDDQRQFRSLHKVGMQVREIRRIISTQALVMFATPLVISIINGAIFVGLLGGLYDLNLWRPVVTVSAIFTLLYGAYYLVARQTYVQTLLGRTLR
ncbi:MAG TPA: FtsX-like permease family protein [Symbiobacteriaceae bacterium]|nr:FtsX-like permease family protein [Symbiobacteriaceae bacterium]